MKLETASEYDLIGHHVTVTSSKNREIVGTHGKVIMETKNMIVLETENGEKNIPKDICQLSNDEGIIKVDSSKISKRPHERLEMLA